MRLMKTMLVVGCCGLMGLATTQAHAQEGDTAAAAEQAEASVVSHQTGPLSDDGLTESIAEPNSWPSRCDVTVFTDRVDRQPSQLFGAATVDCDPGYLPRWPMSVDLFRMSEGSLPEHLTGTQIDCSYTPCSAATDYYTDPAGDTQYCTRVTIKDFGSTEYAWEQNCPIF